MLAVQDTGRCFPLQQFDSCQYLQGQDQERWKLAFLAKCHCSYSSFGSILLDIELCRTRQGLWETNLLYHRSAATGSRAVSAGWSHMLTLRFAKRMLRTGVKMRLLMFCLDPICTFACRIRTTARLIPFHAFFAGPLPPRLDKDGWVNVLTGKS